MYFAAECCWFVEFYRFKRYVSNNKTNYCTFKPRCFLPNGYIFKLHFDKPAKIQ